MHVAGVLPVDLPVSPALRVVHRGAARRGAQGRDERPRDPHLHHAILPQVRPANYHAGESTSTREGGLQGQGRPRA